MHSMWFHSQTSLTISLSILHTTFTTPTTNIASLPFSILSDAAVSFFGLTQSDHCFVFSCVIRRAPQVQIIQTSAEVVASDARVVSNAGWPPLRQTVLYCLCVISRLPEISCSVKG